MPQPHRRLPLRQPLNMPPHNLQNRRPLRMIRRHHIQQLALRHQTPPIHPPPIPAPPATPHCSQTKNANTPPSRMKQPRPGICTPCFTANSRYSAFPCSLYSCAQKRNRHIHIISPQRIRHRPIPRQRPIPQPKLLLAHPLRPRINDLLHPRRPYQHPPPPPAARFTTAAPHAPHASRSFGSRKFRNELFPTPIVFACSAK